MHVDLDQLLDLLLARHGERTAERAERMLPRTIDLARDRDLLEQCGIDPNVLAAILAAEERSAPLVTRRPSTETAVDHAAAAG